MYQRNGKSEKWLWIFTDIRLHFVRSFTRVLTIYFYNTKKRKSIVSNRRWAKEQANREKGMRNVRKLLQIRFTIAIRLYFKVKTICLQVKLVYIARALSKSCRYISISASQQSRSTWNLSNIQRGSLFSSSDPFCSHSSSSLLTFLYGQL